MTKSTPDADLVIGFHQHDFSRADLDSIEQVGGDELKIRITDRGPKPLSDFIFSPELVLQFAAYSTAAGFLERIGAIVFDSLWSRISQLLSKRQQDYSNDYRTGMHVKLSTNLEGNDVSVTIVISTAAAEKMQDESLSLDSALDFLDAKVGGSEVQSVMLGVRDDDLSWYLVQFTDVNGERIPIETGTGLDNNREESEQWKRKELS